MGFWLAVSASHVTAVRHASSQLRPGRLTNQEALMREGGECRREVMRNCLGARDCDTKNDLICGNGMLQYLTPISRYAGILRARGNNSRLVAQGLDLLLICFT